jgi:hypothetical protein
VNVDTDADEPRIGREHAHLLAAEPLLQRLPYRDRQIGVALTGATASGRPLLLVTFSGRRAAARADLQAVLTRLDDPATAYAWRFLRLAGG